MVHRAVADNVVRVDAQPIRVNMRGAWSNAPYCHAGCAAALRGVWHCRVVYSTSYASICDSSRRRAGHPDGRAAAQAVSGPGWSSHPDPFAARLCRRGAGDGDLCGRAQAGDGARAGPGGRVRLRRAGPRGRGRRQTPGIGGQRAGRSARRARRHRAGARRGAAADRRGHHRPHHRRGGASTARPSWACRPWTPSSRWSAPRTAR